MKLCLSEEAKKCLRYNNLFEGAEISFVRNTNGSFEFSVETFEGCKHDYAAIKTNLGILSLGQFVSKASYREEELNDVTYRSPRQLPTKEYPNDRGVFAGCYSPSAIFRKLNELPSDCVLIAKQGKNLVLPLDYQPEQNAPMLSQIKTGWYFELKSDVKPNNVLL